MKKVFDMPSFHSRIKLVGLNKVLLHLIAWTKQAGLFKTRNVAESFSMDRLRREEKKPLG
jgi:hypothetical protein